ncbi:MAG: alpha-1,2-fucosyltransferase [Syntrophobacteraceae bacterium]
MAKVIVRIKGGLGNQLFCYAAARRLALFNSAELVLDDVTGFRRDRQYRRGFQLDKFDIQARKATPFERMEPFERYRRGLAKLIARRKPFFQRTYVEQDGPEFDSRLLDFKVTGTVYLDGLWQSESYFKDFDSTLRQDLHIVPPEDYDNRRVAERIESCNAVGIHVRWFDNLDGTGSGGGFHNLQEGYYSRAVDTMCARVSDPHFFLFSDYPEAARSLIPVPENMITSVTHNGQDQAYADLWLMALCSHFIIANSTFSWWGAWLAEYSSKIVVAPDVRIDGVTTPGFTGLIPQSWHRIEVRCA